MRYLSLVCKRLPATAMAIYPFVIFHDRQAMKSEKILRHGFIHFRQQLELLILPFYVLYLMNYLLNLMVFREHDRAYRNILFEREAYANEANPEYLKHRRYFAWLRYRKLCS